MSPDKNRLISDSQRDAIKYRHLVHFLQRATQELTRIEAQEHPISTDDLLHQLLPWIVRALSAERAFVIKSGLSVQNAPLPFETIALYPEEALATHQIPWSPLLAKLIADGEPQVIPDPGSDFADLIPGLEPLKARAAILVRLVTLEQMYIVGVINRHASRIEPEVGPFLAADRMALDNTLKLIAVGARAAERRQRELKVIQSISEAATQETPDRVCQIIAQQAVELTDARYARLVAVDKMRQRIMEIGAWVHPPGQWAPSQVQAPLNTTTLIGQVVLSKQEYYAPNLSQDRYDQRSTSDEWLGIRSAFCVPLVVQSGSIGALYIASTKLAGIDREEQDFIRQLAPHAAIALHHAQSLEETRRRLAIDETVIKIQQAIADVLTEQQAEQIPAILQPFVQFGSFFIATYEAVSGQIRFPHVFERERRVEEKEKQPETPYGPRQLGERYSLVDFVIESKRAILISDIETWPDRKHVVNEFASDIRCGLYAPMERNGQIVGVIGFRGYERANLFDQDDLDLITKVAPHIAIVLANAQVYAARVHELEAVRQFQQQISQVEETEEQELQNIFKAATAVRALGIDNNNMFIALYRSATEWVEFPLVYERSAEFSEEAKQAKPAYQRRPLGQLHDVTEWIIHTRQPLLGKRQTEILQWNQTLPGVRTAPQRSKSWMGAPMIAAGQLIGVIAVRDFVREYAFDEHHLELLQTIATQAAVAIRNAQLYQVAQHQVRSWQALHGASKAIADAGLERDAVLQAILRQAVEVTGSILGSMRVAQQGGLHLVATWPPEHYTRLSAQYPMIPVQSLRSVIARAFRQNRAQLVVDVTQADDFLDNMDGATGSELAVVLRQGGKEEGEPLGVINVEHAKPGGLTQSHKDLLIGLSNLAVAAIQNANHYAQLQEVRDYASSNEAVAWMGIIAAEKQHTLAQKTSSIRYHIDSLKTWLRHKDVLADDPVHEIAQSLTDVADDIQAIRLAAPLESIADEATWIDRELLQTVQQWRLEFNRQSGTTIRLIADLRCPDIQIKIPRQILRIATEKLVHNALKAVARINSTGIITVRTQCEGDVVWIDIEDTGPGIPEFARSFFLKRPIERESDSTTQGSGMGALMARIVANRYGGNLHLIDTNEQGTKLRLTFPAAKVENNAKES